MPGTAGTAVNAAVEALVRPLAAELARRIRGEESPGLPRRYWPRSVVHARLS
jgi:hypothetical protein